MVEGAVSGISFLKNGEIIAAGVYTELHVPLWIYLRSLMLSEKSKCRIEPTVWHNFIKNLKCKKKSHYVFMSIYVVNIFKSLHGTNTISLRPVVACWSEGKCMGSGKNTHTALCMSKCFTFFFLQKKLNKI